jgi:ubiquinone/menaquinone biosynthesis C-methylase UbiE
LCRGLTADLLEIGCGEGLFLAALAKQNPHLKIQGVDIRQDAVDRAEGRIMALGLLNVKVSCVDSPKLPFADNYFEATVCINTLFNLDSLNEIRQVVREMVRLTKQGGKVIVDMRNCLNPLVCLKYQFAQYYDSTLRVAVRAYRINKIKGILQDEGLAVEKEIPVGGPGWLLPPIVLIQARKR